MFEAENSQKMESSRRLPAKILSRFAELKNEIEKRTVLPWGEHCTECVWPSCYDTCSLYTPRNDGGCRLFQDGMVGIQNLEGPSPYLLKICFKSWGKLWTVGSLNLYRPEEANRLERINVFWGTVARKLHLPQKVIQKAAYWRRTHAERKSSSGAYETPDCFAMEFYNGNDHGVDLTFTVRLRNHANRKPYQKTISVERGFQRVCVDYEKIAGVVPLHEPFEVEIIPNNQQQVCLYFGLMEFVKAKAGSHVVRQTGPATQKEKPAEGGKEGKICKCIVWDLDNTVWDGILIEDGPEKIRLRESVVEVIKETDRRGILHSIASKNNHDDAVKVLEKFGLSEYFLHPQINWGPKSQSFPKIAQLLNIGIDSLMFVDDQPFEREEVLSSSPAVMVLDARDVPGILQLPACQLPITDESRARRQMYREQEQRDTVLSSFEGDYIKFLKECRIRLLLSRLNNENMERVYELAQRTNQMNYSGNRYEKTQLEAMMGAGDLRTYAMRCEDRFGGYGIIGFAVLDVREPRLLDLMFSCRVQGKKVEHAFLGHLLSEYAMRQGRDFHANYRRTKKNEPAGKVFDEMKFRTESEEEGVTSLLFERTQDILDYGVIEITEEN
jgi:FkbH-like protein